MVQNQRLNVITHMINLNFSWAVILSFMSAKFESFFPNINDKVLSS